jgi:hypothetical protein
MSKIILEKTLSFLENDCYFEPTNFKAKEIIDSIRDQINDINFLEEFPDMNEILLKLLENEIVHINSFWWESDWPEDAKKMTSISVICNDVFYPAADLQPICYSELWELWDFWKKDPILGPAAWCIKKRKQRPFQKFDRLFQKSEIWNIDELVNMN